MPSLTDEMTESQIFEHAFAHDVETATAVVQSAETLDVEPQGDGVPFAMKSFGERSQSLIANKERYRDSSAQRSASLAWAALEQAAATDRQTAAIDRQTAALERQAELSQLIFAEQRKHNQLLFFQMSPSDFEPKYAVEPEQIDGQPERASVFLQMKRNLGIAPPAAPAASDEPAPAAAAVAPTEEYAPDYPGATDDFDRD